MPLEKFRDKFAAAAVADGFAVRNCCLFAALFGGFISVPA
jgi:hypothetical protein